MAEGSSSRIWMLWALGAMFSYATNNFLLGAVGKKAKEAAGADTAKDANISAIFVVWLTAGICGCIGWAGLCWKGSRPDFGGWANVGLVVAVGLLIAGATFSLTLALAIDTDSAGPITAMLPLNSLVVCALAYALLGERLTTQHLIGMGIAIAGPVCMAVADTNTHALQGLLLGTATAVVFGTSNLLRKWVATRRGVDNNSLLVGILSSIGAIAVLAIAIMCISGRGLRGLDAERSLFAACSGLLWAAGTLSFQFALMGLAGPASAIANTNSVGVLLLDQLFFHVAVVPLKVVGMLLCIAGCVTLSLAPRQARGVPLTSGEAAPESENPEVSLAEEPKV